MKRLRLATIAVLCVFVMVQVTLLFVFLHAPQHSDQIVHIRFATNAFTEGSLYPSVSNLYDSYFLAPGLINFFVLQLWSFGTVDYNGFFQFLMNVIMLYEVFYIAKKLFSEKTAYLAVILYCLTYSNYMGILVFGTEIPFLFLALTGFCLCLTLKWYYILFAAFFFALSNTIRPLVILFVILAVAHFVWKRVNWRLYVWLIVPFLMFNWGYGKFNEARIGHFVNQSTTGGTNLIQTAHDRADGTTANGSVIVLEKSSPYAYGNNTDKTFYEKDKMWKNAGMEWIKEHPGKYCLQFFKKIPYLYADDAWPERLVFDTGFSKSMDKETDSNTKIRMVLMLIFKNLLYYALLLLFIYSLFVYKKEIISEKGLLLLYLILGTGATVLFPVMPRYHYPFMFVITIWAAYGMEYIINKYSRN